MPLIVPVSLPHLHPLLCTSPGCQPSSLSFTLTLIWQQCTNVLHSVCLNRQHCSSAVIVVFRSFIVILILICTVFTLRQLVNSIHCFSYTYSETCLKTATCGPVKTGHYRELGCIIEETVMFSAVSAIWGQGRLAAVDRWLHCTMTTIDRFYCT